MNHLVARTIVFVLASVCATWHVWLDILTIALRDEEARHVFLVPIVFAGLVWLRRDAIGVGQHRGNWIGIPLILAGVLSHQIGLANSIVVLFHLSAILVFVGGLCLALGARFLWSMAPALFVLLFLL